MKDNVVQIRPFSKFQCSKCGIDASCDCGAPVVSKASRIREALKENPEKPNKQIAREVGAEPHHVRRERQKLEGDHGPPKGFIIGPGSVGPDDQMPTEEEADESWQNDLYDQACLLLERMADSTRARILAHIKRTYADEV